MATRKTHPEEQQSLTASLVVDHGKEALNYYKKAFGAQVVGEFYAPEGDKLMHASLKIGPSHFWVTETMPASRPPSPGGDPSVVMNIYTDDCDAMYDRAIQAGGKSKQAPADQFWGDRFGLLADPFGHLWGIVTHQEDVSPDELKKRAREQSAHSAHHR